MLFLEFTWTEEKRATHHLSWCLGLIFEALENTAVDSLDE